MKKRIVVLVALNAFSLVIVFLGCLSKAYFSKLDIVVLTTLVLTLLVQIFALISECRTNSKK